MNILLSILLSVTILNYTDYDIDSKVKTISEQYGIEDVTVVITYMPEHYFDNNLNMATKTNNYYHIYLQTGLNDFDLEYFLTHEMIHVSQLYSNQLKLHSDGIVEFNGKKYNTEYVDVDSRPWEIEAHREAKKLNRK